MQVSPENLLGTATLSGLIFSLLFSRNALCNMVVSKTKTPKSKTRKLKTYENEDLRKQRPPTKTKTFYENEDPFIFYRKRNNLSNFVGNDFVGNEVISI